MKKGMGWPFLFLGILLGCGVWPGFVAKGADAQEYNVSKGPMPLVTFQTEMVEPDSTPGSYEKLITDPATTNDANDPDVYQQMGFFALFESESPESQGELPSIPDTGQTKCYGAGSNELNPCPTPGEPFYGQDVQYQPQHPRSYAKLGLGGVELPDDATFVDDDGPWIMTRDLVTGLIWEVKQAMDGTLDYANPNDADNLYTWYDSNPETNGGNAGTSGDGITTFDTEQFINGLNAASYGGFDDWRMPTIKELRTLPNLGVYDPAIDVEWFPGTKSNYYWSSTTRAIYAGGAWAVRFDNGQVATNNKFSSNFVRAVRGGPSGLLDNSMMSGRMVDNQDGTVTDTIAGLMWQQTTAPGTYDWEQALAYAESAETAGYDDWRLPNINELHSLVDFTMSDPAIDSIAFPGVPASNYWSSTNNPGFNTFCACVVSFEYGNAGSNVKTYNSNYVRAVRGGQFGSFGHVVIYSPVRGGKYMLEDNLSILWDPSGYGDYVRVDLSRDGGKTYTKIAGPIPNNGSCQWQITGPATVNAVLRIRDADALGDINGDGEVDLADAVMVLQICAGIEPLQPIHIEADVNGDDKIGMEEVIYILQTVSGIR